MNISKKKAFLFYAAGAAILHCALAACGGSGEAAADTGTAGAGGNSVVTATSGTGGEAMCNCHAPRTVMVKCGKETGADDAYVAKLDLKGIVADKMFGVMAYGIPSGQPTFNGAQGALYESLPTALRDGSLVAPCQFSGDSLPDVSAVVFLLPPGL